MSYLFFSEILLANRDKMIPGNSFLINIVKEKMTNGTTRLTTRKLTEINSIKEAKINNAEITIKNLESINECVDALLVPTFLVNALSQIQEVVRNYF